MPDRDLRSDLIHSIQDALGRAHLSAEDLCNDLIDSIEPTIRDDERERLAQEIEDYQPEVGRSARLGLRIAARIARGEATDE